jgi:mannose/fructose/N-acetylgalactosamine-specific phosphotransferase system component IIC
MFAVMYTLLVLLVPYFKSSEMLKIQIIQISVVSIIYGLLMAVIQPKVEINRYKKKQSNSEEEENDNSLGR